MFFSKLQVLEIPLSISTYIYPISILRERKRERLYIQLGVYCCLGSKDWFLWHALFSGKQTKERTVCGKLAGESSQDQDLQRK